MSFSCTIVSARCQPLITFTVPPPDAGRRLVLRGLVEVEWRKRRRAVERRRLRTTAGHADAADPALQVSRRSCEIRR